MESSSASPHTSPLRASDAHEVGYSASFFIPLLSSNISTSRTSVIDGQGCASGWQFGPEAAAGPSCSQ